MSTTPDRTKAIGFRLVAAALGTLLGAGAVALTVFAYIHWKVSSRESVDRRLLSVTALRQFMRDPAFQSLWQALEAERGAAFETTWDFDSGVALDQNLFVPTEMYGQSKYRYRENTDVLNAVVWTGSHDQSMVVRASDDVLRLLGHCQVKRFVHFTTDRHGFKPTVFAEAGSGHPIFLLGDSFTEGLHVSPEKTFASRLGDMLPATGLSGVPLNLGVNGYSALEMCWMVEKFSPELDPEAIILNLFPNDVHANYDEVIQGRGADEREYQEMFFYLDRIRRHCGEHDRLFVICVIPSKEQFGRLKDFGVFQDRVSQWCNANGVGCLDPRSDFERLGADNVYLPGDPHFSEEGHHHYAEFLFRDIHDDLARLERSR